MLAVRHYLLAAACGLAWFALAACARAEPIHEPNNSPGAAYMLPSGQMAVSDDLNGTQGRPDTLLAEYNMTYSTLLAMADNTPGVGNGLGSQLLDVPLLFNGAALFRVTGAPDTGFVGDHTQSGKYSITYEVHNPAHELVKTLTQYEWVTPGMVDNMWLPPDNSLADWTGYTADVTVNNIVGPGSGDSLDFYMFSGLEPFMPFTAQLTDVAFDALIGLYDGNTLVATGTLVDGVPTLSGMADSMGRVKIGVTGAGDGTFVGAHDKVGTYTLQVTAVPEPAGFVLFAAGAALLCASWRRRRGQVRSKGRRSAVKGTGSRQSLELAPHKCNASVQR